MTPTHIVSPNVCKTILLEQKGQSQYFLVKNELKANNLRFKSILVICVTCMLNTCTYMLKISQLNLFTNFITRLQSIHKRKLKEQNTVKGKLSKF